MVLTCTFFVPLTALAVAAAVLPSKSLIKQDTGGGPTSLWALLVAGSKGYENYRHQADICHAYQVLHNRGVPDKRIVVMMYDDIAENDENPTTGKIFNHRNGRDVYGGVPKDYTKEAVTTENFLQILQGKNVSGGSGKVIASGRNDHIFIFFSGHGGRGVLQFPTDMLNARKFVNVIIKMRQQRKFSRMVLYIEACHSGSMFDGLLPNNLHVYATTAADAYGPSYSACVDKTRGVPLGNIYSATWMKDSEENDLTVTTLSDQFRRVRKNTSKSQVMLYGDTSLMKIQLYKFQGSKKTKRTVTEKVTCEPISNHDVPIAILSNKVQRATDPGVKKHYQQQLNETLNNRAFVNRKIIEIATFISGENVVIAKSLLAAKRKLTRFGCYERALSHFNVKCFSISNNPYALQHLHVLLNACESGYRLNDIINAMNSACTHPHLRGIV